jgi:predicted nucleotidyltransferase
MLHDLSSLLFSDYRRRVLGVLLLQPDAQYHVRELARQTGTSAGTLHKELSRLARAGILRRKAIGNQVFYSADPACLIYEELASILRKTSGLADVLAQALAPVSESLRVALIFGSMARGTAQPSSDVDLLLIGDLDFVTAVRLFHSTQVTLGREINPKIYRTAEWQAKLEARDTFACDVIAKPKIFLIGNDDDLGKPAGKDA